MTQLTKHFALAELAHTSTKLENTPPSKYLPNLLRLATVLERVRKICGDRAISISSGYRCPEVNIAVSGSPVSAHLFGLGADFTVAGLTCRQVSVLLAPLVAELNLDQLIFEGTWVHIGLALEGKHPRHAVLTAIRNPGKKTEYMQGVL